MQSEAQATNAPLTHPVLEDSHSQLIARQATAVWAAIAAALSPVVGHDGVAALFDRTLSMSGEAYPWLAAAGRIGTEATRFSALEQLLSAQPDAVAAAAQQFLLRTFIELLTTLIGSALTERLLSAAISTHAAGTPTQDGSK